MARNKHKEKRDRKGVKRASRQKSREASRTDRSEQPANLISNPDFLPWTNVLPSPPSA